MCVCVLYIHIYKNELSCPLSCCQEAYYEINWKTISCKKKQLDSSFIPIHVPEDARLMGQVIMGSSSSWGMGVLVNTWYGTLPNNGEMKDHLLVWTVHYHQYVQCYNTPASLAKNHIQHPFIANPNLIWSLILI